jgi:phytoene synthase
MSPDQYCESKVAQSGSNLVSAFKILPQDRKSAITALYAFCREVDDVVDECTEPQLAAIKLAWWKTEIDRLFDLNATHPVTKALTPALTQYQLTREPFEEIIAGVTMDLQQNRYAAWQDIDLYCDRVAGAVGLLSAKIFGQAAQPGQKDQADQKDAKGQISQATLQYAVLLGRALQYTNIIRDVGDDARKGRIYIPAQCLAEHRVDPASILRFESSAPLIAALNDMANRAHQLYDQAIDTLPKAERAAQRPGLIMAAIYRDLLRLLQSESFNVMNQRISVAPARKVWLAWQAAIGILPR